jgi:hypothetical protein
MKKHVVIIVSDLSGTEIAPDDHVTVTVKFNGGQRYELDATKGEVANLIEAGHRKPKRKYTRRNHEADAAITTT